MRLHPTDIRGVSGSAVKDEPTVTSTGEPHRAPIDGVQIRVARTHADERGTLCEIFDPRWGFDDNPIVFVYTATVRPGQLKGWVVHLRQDDRLFFSSGTARVSLFDAREESETFGGVNVLHAGAHERVLLRIPAGVYHAVRNVGLDDVVFVNMPTRPYEHEDPDKYRLPADTDLIPVRP
jgi:dTDP-4-dehydrorhamnose 3,5-epimerase